MAAQKQFATVVETLGWDEALLGVQTDDPETPARAIQAGYGEATQRHCTVGIGQNRLQAKLAALRLRDKAQVAQREPAGGRGVAAPGSGVHRPVRHADRSAYGQSGLDGALRLRGNRDLR